MNTLEYSDQVAAFNGYAKVMHWLDFDLVSCSPNAAVLACGTDLTASPNVEIRFDDIFFATVLATWKTETAAGPVLRILGGPEAISLNMQYQVERGYHLFAFQPEGLADGVRCVIAAKGFTWRKLKDM